MTTIADILQGAVDDAFELQGIAATFTPSGGSGVSVKVLPAEEDELVDVPGLSSRIQTETNVFDLRASEVAAPKAGDALVAGGSSYTVAGKRRLDPRQLIWRLDVRPV